MRMFAACLALALAACDEGDSNERSPSPSPVPSDAVLAWDIGPTTSGGGNYSVGLPKNPSLHPEGFAFDIGPAQEPHYITKARSGSLAGKVMRMRYRVEGPADAVIYGKGCSTGSPSAVTLYFQKAGDNFRSDGGRWWATRATVYLTKPTAEVEIVAPMEGFWSSVEKMTTENALATFNAAKASPARVGFTFANCEGYGHGARATKPVKFIVTAFEVIDAP